MALTFRQIQDEVLNHGFDESYRPRVKNWVNEGQQRFARAIRSPASQEVAVISVSSTNVTAGLPSDFERLESVYDTTVSKLLDSSSLKEILQAPARFGRPNLFAVDNSTSSLVFYPAPDADFSFQLRYWAAPTDLSADSDQSIIPAAWQDLLITYALMKAYRAEDDFEAAAFYNNQFREDLARAAVDLQYRDISPQQVPGTWDR